jgi:hypothetical protein
MTGPRTFAADSVTLTLSSILWDRAVDSIGTDYPGLGRGGPWTYRKRGYGGQYSVTVDRRTGDGIARYLAAIGRLDGSGMDPDGAADTRREAKAARQTVARYRRQYP